MALPSASDPVQMGSDTASTTSLPLPQLAEVEKGLQTRRKAVSDFDRDIEPQSSAEKSEALEDEEWLESPDHPRNWSSGKKWANMAIVS